MTRTYSNNNNIYSVDMMFAYINIYKPKYKKLNIKLLLDNLKYKGWGNPKTKEFYSPLDVLDNKVKYEKEYNRILNANLKYPIIVHNNIIIDGIHRLTKAWLMGKKTIKVYNFDKNIMKKFLIDNKGNWEKIDKIDMYVYIELFYRRFC